MSEQLVASSFRLENGEIMVHECDFCNGTGVDPEAHNWVTAKCAAAEEAEEAERGTA